jgi:hypothetical protein
LTILDPSLILKHQRKRNSGNGVRLGTGKQTGSRRARMIGSSNGMKAPKRRTGIRTGGRAGSSNGQQRKLQQRRPRKRTKKRMRIGGWRMS